MVCGKDTFFPNMQTVFLALLFASTDLPCHFYHTISHMSAQLFLNSVLFSWSFYLSLNQYHTISIIRPFLVLVFGSVRILTLIIKLTLHVIFYIYLIHCFSIGNHSSCLPFFAVRNKHISFDSIAEYILEGILKQECKDSF